MGEREADPQPSRRVALLLEYNGGRYAGSQLQANALTIQSVLEDAIERATETRARVNFAGRTDAGVHALGQVASFLTASRLDPAVMLRALNAWLPTDVVVREVADVAWSFDPRREALERHYRYLVDNGETRPALDRERAWFVPAALDVDTMLAAAHGLLGRHDFAAFAAPVEPAGASSVRDLRCFDIRRRGRTIVCDVVANAFLRHQVRRMVGALVEVGKGARSAGGFVALLEGPPASAGPVAPALGLYLIAVTYPAPIFGAALDSESKLC